MVIIYRLTGAVILRPLYETTTEVVTREFLYYFYAYYSAPE